MNGKTMSEAKLPPKTKKLNAFDPRFGELWKRAALRPQSFTFESPQLATRFLFRLNQYRRAAEFDKHPDAPLFRRALGTRKGCIVILKPVELEFASVLDNLPLVSPDQQPTDREA